MTGSKVLFSSLAVLLVTTTDSFAAETERIYSSSILALAVVIFLALIVIIQLIPAFMALANGLKDLAKKRAKQIYRT